MLNVAFALLDRAELHLCIAMRHFALRCATLPLLCWTGLNYTLALRHVAFALLDRAELHLRIALLHVAFALLDRAELHLCIAIFPKFQNPCDRCATHH